MSKIACPYCFRDIDTSRLAYQCSGSGRCERVTDESWQKITGMTRTAFPAFIPESGQRPECPRCGDVAKQRACPVCHTALPADTAGAKGVLIGLAGSKGSGKTVLMTVLVRHLRDVIGRRFQADIRMVSDDPDGHQGITDYQASREKPLYDQGVLPAGTPVQGSAGRERAAPIILRWRSAGGRLMLFRKPTLLSFVDTAGEDQRDFSSVFALEHLSAADAMLVALDPFALPSARAQLSLPDDAIQVADDTPLNVLSHLADMLRTEHGVNRRGLVRLPVAVVFTKMDAFYPVLQSDDQMKPLIADTPDIPAYDDLDGQDVHELMKSLLEIWHADDIERFMQHNFANYRYFAVSALGAEPDYANARVAPGGVRPHRVADPVLWLLWLLGGPVPESRRRG